MISICLQLMLLLNVQQDIELCKKIRDNTALSPELTYLIVAKESTFKQSAHSPQGAVGLMQITPIALEDIKKNILQYSTQKTVVKPEIVGLLANCMPVLSYDFNFITSNREANIRAGTCFLAYLLDKFNGDEWKALAYYNCGLVCVKQLEKRRPLNTETANYLIWIERMRRRLK